MRGENRWEGCLVELLTYSPTAYFLLNKRQLPTYVARNCRIFLGPADQVRNHIGYLTVRHIFGYTEPCVREIEREYIAHAEQLAEHAVRMVVRNAFFVGDNRKCFCHKPV